MVDLVREARACSRIDFAARHPGWFLVPPSRAQRARAQSATVPRLRALSRLPTEAMVEDEAPMPSALFALRARDDGGPLHVGRTDDNDVIVDDLTVSRRHASLVLGEQRVEMVDLGSRNGSKVRGIALRPGESQSLYSGDSITIGSVLLLLVDARACWDALTGAHR